MTIKVAINGFGRIGRNILRALYESHYREYIQVVAINDLGEPDIYGHLFSYDTVHGTFKGSVHVTEKTLVINNDHISTFSEKDPACLPWKELEIDIVYECTGHFASKEKASAHIKAGAKKVIISAPAEGVDATIVFGVNDDTLRPEHTIISNASCTTNCLAPIVKPIHDAIGIKQGMMTTIHAITNDQVITDTYHKDVRRARSATQSMIPTKTGAAAAIGLVIPELSGKLDGIAVRVPTANVSLVDLTLTVARRTSVGEINEIMMRAEHKDPYGILKTNELPLVSIDFNHDSASSIFDLTQTHVIENLVKVLAWYDNEWGFSHRMLDNTLQLMNAAESVDQTFSAA